jgi:hypothetical protein
MPNIVYGVVNETSRVFFVDINVTNTFKCPVTINVFTAQLQTPDGQRMATVTIDTPVTICPHES